MSEIVRGTIAGIIFGIASLIPMIFIKIDEKAKAMLASFVNRFTAGFVIFNMSLPIDNWLKGALVGLVFSLPPAIISGKYPPIVGLGIIGGIICGLCI